MKFPKEKVLIEQKIKDYLENKSYYQIFQMSREILDNASTLDDYTFSSLLASTFYIGNFDKVVLFYSELKNKEIETFDTIYYCLQSLLANNDIYQAMSIIKKSELLNTEDIASLFTSDGANYSNLLETSFVDEDMGKTLLIVNFIKGLMIEINHQNSITTEYILYRYFDLLNLIYELGYSLNIIQELSLSMKIIFNLSL